MMRGETDDVPLSSFLLYPPHKLVEKQFQKANRGSGYPRLACTSKGTLYCLLRITNTIHKIGAMTAGQPTARQPMYGDGMTAGTGDTNQLDDDFSYNMERAKTTASTIIKKGQPQLRNCSKNHKKTIRNWKRKCPSSRRQRQCTATARQTNRRYRTTAIQYGKNKD
jgi:hypothetical protein